MYLTHQGYHIINNHIEDVKGQVCDHYSDDTGVSPCDVIIPEVCGFTNWVMIKQGALRIKLIELLVINCKSYSILLIS